MDARNALGTASELMVALNLTERGYEVFHSYDGKTSCDLVILKGGKLQQVEVKSQSRSIKNGRAGIQTLKRQADILAVVCNRTISYYPPLPRDN